MRKLVLRLRKLLLAVRYHLVFLFFLLLPARLMLLVSGGDLKSFAKSAVNSAFVLAGLSLLARLPGLGRGFVFLGCVLFGAASALEVIHISIYGGLPTPNVYFSIFETDLNESIEYAAGIVGLWQWAILIAMIVGCWKVAHGLTRETGQSSRFLNYLIFGGIGSIVLLMVARQGVGSVGTEVLERTVLRTYASYGAYRKEHEAFLRELEKFKPSNLRPLARASEKASEKASETKEENYVLVIGESVSRGHMGLYGYERETTPLMRKRADSGLIWVYSDVISPHCHTNASLQKVLTTFRSDGRGGSDFDGSILDVMKAHGFTTYWISNQVSLHDWDRTVTAIARSADKKIFLNLGDHSSEVQPDSVLLEPYRAILNDGNRKRFIVLHLMGSHFDYKSRYPKNFSHFGNTPKIPAVVTDRSAAELINAYDNSILFTDYILDEAIRTLETTSGSSALLYLSDHGEEVYDFRDFIGHTEAAASPQMFEIPFILWVSPEFVRGRRTFVEELARNLSAPYVSDDFIHSLQELFDVRVEGFAPHRSIFNNAFRPRINRVMGLRTYVPARQFKVDDVVAKNGFAFDERIWVHRVNSIPRLKEVFEHFKGFEVDVVFDDQRDVFDITHPPEPSIGLTLKSYLESADFSNRHLWLDFKNLDDRNRGAAARRLSELVGVSGLKKRNIVVESTSPIDLKSFSELGFITSYYLPAFNLSRGDEDLAATGTITAALRTSPVNAISADAKYLRYLKRQYPSSFKLTWDTSINWQSEADRQRAYEILKDPTIKVLLVHFSSPSFR